MSFGASKSDSESRPLNAAERTELYNAAYNLLGPNVPGYNTKPDQVTHHQAQVGYLENGLATPYLYGNSPDGNPLPGYGRARVIPEGATNVNYDPKTGMLTYDTVEKGASYFENAYQAPQYSDPGAAKTLSGGDYDRLEQSILQSRTAPLDRQYALDREMLDESLAKRGIWSSGLAARAQNDLSERYAPAYAQAGGEATAQRYGMQSGELANLNNYALQQAGARNAYDMENANRLYQSLWRPADYLAGLWNGTGGSVASSSSFGFNVAVPK